MTKPVTNHLVSDPGKDGLYPNVPASAGSGPRPWPGCSAAQQKVAVASAAPTGAESFGSATEMKLLS